MEMYGVSRTVMREALRTLTSKGLVESRPKIGTRVRPRGVWNLLDADLLDWYARVAPPLAFALKLQEMRGMVEPYAAALAARMHTPATFEAIDGAARAMAAARNVDEWVRADLRFHLSVLEAGGNELLVPLGTLIDRTLEAQLHLNARRADVYNASLAEHTAVSDAIRMRDEDGARRDARADRDVVTRNGGRRGEVRRSRSRPACGCARSTPGISRAGSRVAAGARRSRRRS